MSDRTTVQMVRTVAFDSVAIKRQNKVITDRWNFYFAKISDKPWWTER